MGPDCMTPVLGRWSGPRCRNGRGLSTASSALFVPRSFTGLVENAAEQSFASLASFVRDQHSLTRFLPGTIFILLVNFVPRGIAGACTQLQFRWVRSRTAEVDPSITASR